jgi:hypothetical protein
MMRFGEFDLVNMLHDMEIFLSLLGILERNNLMFTIVWWREIDLSISLEFPIFLSKILQIGLSGYSMLELPTLVATTRFLVIF